MRYLPYTLSYRHVNVPPEQEKKKEKDSLGDEESPYYTVGMRLFRL